MKSAKKVRTVDAHSRVTIPAYLIRDIFKKKVGETFEVEIYYTDDSVILKKYQPTCSFCDRTDSLKEYMGVKFCPDCIKIIKNL